MLSLELEGIKLLRVGIEWALLVSNFDGLHGRWHARGLVILNL